MGRVELIGSGEGARPPTAAAAAAATRAAELEAAYGGLPSHDLIRLAAERLFAGRIAVVSSFGAESAVLLDLIV